MSAITIRVESNFKNYNFIRKLGQGNFGSVFEATNEDNITGKFNGKRAVKFEVQNVEGSADVGNDEEIQGYVDVLNEFNALLSHSPFVLKTYDSYGIIINLNLVKLSNLKILKDHYKEIYKRLFEYILEVLGGDVDIGFTEKTLTFESFSKESVDLLTRELSTREEPTKLSVTELELADGTLTKLLQDCSIRRDDRINIIFQLLWNQYSMQRLGIYHYDIKPDNILYQTQKSPKKMILRTSNYDTKNAEYFELNVEKYALKLTDYNVSSILKDNEFSMYFFATHAGTPAFSPIKDIFFDKFVYENGKNQKTYKTFHAETDLFGVGLVILLIDLNGHELKKNTMSKEKFDFETILGFFDYSKYSKIYDDLENVVKKMRKIFPNRALSAVSHIVSVLSLQHYIGNGFLPDLYPERRNELYDFFIARKEEILNIGKGFFVDRPEMNIYQYLVKKMNPDVRDLVQSLIQWDGSKQRKFPDHSSNMERGAYVHNLLSNSPLFEAMKIKSLPKNVSGMEIYGFDTPEDITFFPIENQLKSLQIKMKLSKSISQVPISIVKSKPFYHFRNDETDQLINTFTSKQYKKLKSLTSSSGMTSSTGKILATDDHKEIKKKLSLIFFSENKTKQ